MDSKALEMLIDSSLTALDISYSRVTDAALQNALQTTPNLLSLDVTGCQLSQRTVRALGTWCPQLQVLRLGWSDCYLQFIFSIFIHSKHVLDRLFQDRSAIDNASPLMQRQHMQLALFVEACQSDKLSFHAGSRSMVDDRTWAINMKHIMPSVAQQSNAADSWEALSPSVEPSTASAEEQSNASSAPARLSQLTYLIWPQIPAKTSDLLARKFPKVVVNPKSRFCSTQADQKADLDEQFMQMVAPFWQQEEEQVKCKLPNLILTSFFCCLSQIHLAINDTHAQMSLFHTGS